MWFYELFQLSSRPAYSQVFNCLVFDLYLIRAMSLVLKWHVCDYLTVKRKLRRRFITCLVRGTLDLGARLMRRHLISSKVCVSLSQFCDTYTLQEGCFYIDFLHSYFNFLQVCLVFCLSFLILMLMPRIRIMVVCIRHF